MPTYSYRCTECGEAFDIQQSFTDDALTVCPNCGGPLRKLFNTVGVTFNGSGFYRTDSRAKPKSESGDSTSSSSGSSGSSGSSTSAPTSPAAAPAAPKKERTRATSSAKE
jgi:putative FmdB family regulatory protein